ncbi:hypothetical protein [Adhaeribacter soli]|uniref:Uncharacterized protein n=1 Tax=Adhaeribacter soli TaxID=2607655 RepID=A0A5N1JA04_9BACT|nr:hypothetical protein [Adhaeribacter soli]KAA9345838.1 hypothetical protein F0P94_01780 [Adhaeribacter soli]
MNKDFGSGVLEEVIELKLKVWERLILGTLSSFFFFPCIYFLIKFIPELSEIFAVGGVKSLLILIVVLFCFLFVIDFILFVNHFLFEAFRTVIFYKTSKILTIRNSWKYSEIDLKNDQYDAIRYIPRAGSRWFPGEGYGKIVIMRGKERFFFSETILEGSSLWLTLLSLNSKENLKEVKWQFNFIW